MFFQEPDYFYQYLLLAHICSSLQFLFVLYFVLPFEA